MINLSRVNNQQGFAIPTAPASLLASKPSSSSRMTDTSSMLAQALSRVVPRRPRGEKKPIPDEQKDERYFERRKRNNLAAKKSRDQRKMREDAISLRASFLEKENALMRTQVSALREERNSLQGLLLRRQLAVKHREMLNVLVVEQQQKQVQYLELLKQHEAEAAAKAAAKASTSQQKEPKESLPQQQQEIVDLTVSKNKEENHRAHETSLPTTSTEEKVQSET